MAQWWESPPAGGQGQRSHVGNENTYSTEPSRRTLSLRNGLARIIFGLLKKKVSPHNGRVDDPVSYVKHCREQAERSQGEEHERLHKLYALYRAKPDPSIYQSVVTRSQYVVPVIYKTVETVLPRIMSVLFSASPPIQSRYRIKLQDPGAELRLRSLDQLFEWYFDRQRLFFVFEAWIKESLIYGQSYLQIGWKQKKRTHSVRLMDLANGVPTERTQQKTEVVEDLLDVQNVDVFDLWFAPEAHFPDPFGTAKWVIKDSRKRRSQLIAMAKAGQYNDFDPDELAPRSIVDRPSDQRQVDINRSPLADQTDEEDPMVNLCEYWEDERVITTANHSVLLRDEPNPYGLPGRARRKPFVACFDTLAYGMLFQIGEGEPLEHTQIENSTLRRQRTDNNTLSINTGIIYDKDSDFDLNSWGLARPGMAVGVRSKDGDIRGTVMPIPRQEVTGTTSRDLGDLDKDAQEISGLLDYAVGNAPERRETATTVQLLQAAANARFDIKVRNYSYAMQDAAFMMFERLKQCQTTPVPLRIPQPMGMGFDFALVSNKELPEFEQVDLSVPGSPDLLLKDARNQKLLQYVQMLQSNPAAPPQAALLMMILALKEADLDGIEQVVQVLQQASQVPPMGMGPVGPQAMAPAQPPMPMRAPGPGGPQLANERPVVLPMPSPNR